MGGRGNKWVGKQERDRVWGKRTKGRTVSIAIVSGHFLSDTYRLDDSKSDIPSFTEKFDIMITVVLCVLFQYLDSMGCETLNIWF